MKSKEMVAWVFLILTSVLTIDLEGCALCDAIEKKRAEEQAKKGPQKDQYYEDQFQNKITKDNHSEKPSN